ncbi:hypothetical protein GHT89_16335 [Acinetobacter baumannii]|uniref:hypothetical protein n=1 Tax=Acinetobacter baumannii TaxID=470 RepID=UPI00387DBF2B
MHLVVEKNHRKQVVKPCLECKNLVDSKVHGCRSFKGHLLHIRCADNLFSQLFLISPLADRKTFLAIKKKSKEIVKIDKCLICGVHASGATGFKHRIVYDEQEVQLKIHRTCFFSRFNMEYDPQTKKAMPGL